MTVADQRAAQMAALSTTDVAEVLPGWVRPVEAVRACFSDAWRKLAHSRSLAGDHRTVVFLSYENPWAASGGLLAVVRRLPRELEAAVAADGSRKNERYTFIRLSPHHSGLTTQPDKLSLVARCNVLFDRRVVEVRIHQAILKPKKGPEEVWFLFGADGFFTADGGPGGRDPYIHSFEDQASRDGDASALLRNSLFACKAVPAVLAALQCTKGVIVHAQDWQFASAALTVKEAIVDGALESAVVVLTCHNPYDHGLSQENLARITMRSSQWHWPTIGWIPRTTVLTRMIPLTDAPVSVVSHQFASELTASPIQLGVFTGHLRDVFEEQGLVGIDNGDFGTATTHPFSTEAVLKARQGDPSAILAEKSTRRTAMLSTLGQYLKDVDRDNPATLTFGRLTGADGQSLDTLPANVPVFMMIGRLDPGQKGYDVCATLIETLPRGIARFVLTPVSPLAEDSAVRPFIDQLKTLAETRTGEVVVFAHRMERAYKETMAGATYSLWPSRYEPFGGATEFYENGTPVIAHAVGGLLQQVIGYTQAPADATGFLYQSLGGNDRFAALKRQYQQAHNAAPEARRRIPVYQRECSGLERAAADGINLFHGDRAGYARLLANLGDMLDTLGWQKPAQDYLAWYDAAWK
jgi:glycogen synthase